MLFRRKFDCARWKPTDCTPISSKGRLKETDNDLNWQLAAASNHQEIAICAALPDGVDLYDATPHQPEKIISGDLRAATGTQPYVAESSLNLVYVADYAKMPNLSDADKIFYSAADTGYRARRPSQTPWLVSSAGTLDGTRFPSFARHGRPRKSLRSDPMARSEHRIPPD